MLASAMLAPTGCTQPDNLWERGAVALSGPEATAERWDGGKVFLCPPLSWGCKCDTGPHLSQGWSPILFKGFNESFL